MTQYKVSYTDLRTNDHTKLTLAEGLTFNHVAGLQRGLIVLQGLNDSKVVQAYSSIAYFHQNHTLPSEVQFFREEDVIWDPKDALTRLSKSKSRIEVLADVDPHSLIVTLNTDANPIDLRRASGELGYEGLPEEKMPNAEDLRALGFDMDAPLEITESKPEPKVLGLQLERYLTGFGAFSRSQNKRTKILKKPKR